METNPLLKLESFGQSIWIDFISRGMLHSGQLKKLIDEDGISGVTSNPSIFEKAITSGKDYDDAIRRMVGQGKNAAQIYLELTIEDIQATADLLRPVFEASGGLDGFASLEVSPGLAYDTGGTLAEARQLWKLVNRPNLLVKVPATPQGIPAIRKLIGEGINVNVTLLFGLPRYREVAGAYLKGLDDLAASGKPLDHAVSVASFFLSRIDVLVDPMLEQKMWRGHPQADQATSLHGMTAIYSARVAYDMYQKMFEGESFARLAQAGARPQRLLWASTSTKNPAYTDVKYVEALIAPQTINTLPVETLEDYRDHGNPLPRLLEEPVDSCLVRERLSEIGIDLDMVTQQLEEEGVLKFKSAYDQSLAAVTAKILPSRVPARP